MGRGGESREKRAAGRLGNVGSVSRAVLLCLGWWRERYEAWGEGGDTGLV